MLILVSSTTKLYNSCDNLHKPPDKKWKVHSNEAWQNKTSSTKMRDFTLLFIYNIFLLFH